ncbi:TPA: restriction endonuclease subunit S [Escherichia coli]|jgi:type I restriction enzyme S subunit|uniref:Restriction endonuclease subunit S n=3 Tax=Escherichia coli TaxID=562 RepID=A0A6L7C6Y2_ECOLX|nr:restriction endonuclease subunit S [Escherichia coli]EGF7324325.1 restriction endonuclease subunit S [Escherichia coli]EHR1102362.1 restriction endonuclease subunit S [Escherichia coli]EIW7835402.1 restriction endonuclease subunit S [Escherichia coli]EKL2571574.1 restriction endonuclease subunit S [Escherichia coli]EKO7013429.1 restriction endonuclease subunit S [Escherichia coli]
MGSNYIEMRLEDCMDAIIDYRGKTPKKVDNGIPLITAKIIKNGRIQEVNEFIAINDYDDWMVRGLPLEGDVVLTTEAPLGEVAQLDARKVALAQRVITLRGKKGILENDYLLYLLQSSFVQNQLDGRASGSTVTGIKQSELREIILRLPPVSLQKSISHQLKCLDKKIDLNNKINKTLEQMSQTLFKSWFVDFDPVIDNALDAGNPIPEALQTRTELRQKVRNSADFKPLPAEIRSLFPSEFEETEVGYLPAKWIYSGLSKLIDIKHGFAFKGEYFSETKTNQILLTPGNVRIGGGFKFDKLKYYKGEIPKDYIFGVDDIFVSMTDLSKECDSLGYAARVPSREDTQFLHNQRLGRVILGKHPSSVKEFIYQVLISQNYRNTVLGSVTGTTVKHTSPSKILSHVISHSENGEVERKFDSICSNISLAISRNNENNRILLKLRDTLLPKLISGELTLEDLPDLNTETEAA